MNVCDFTDKKGCSLDLNKHISLDLAKFSNLNVVRLGLGWKAGKNGENFDLDASAFLLDKKGLIQVPNKHVIYYNIPDTGLGVWSLGDDKVGSTEEEEGGADNETIFVDLSRVPNDIKKILFVVTIHQARIRRQNFGMIKDAYIRIINDETDEELAIYKLSENFGINTALEIACLERTDHGWEFKKIGKGFNEDLEDILIRHGCR